MHRGELGPTDKWRTRAACLRPLAHPSCAFGYFQMTAVDVKTAAAPAPRVYLSPARTVIGVHNLFYYAYGNTRPSDWASFRRPSAIASTSTSASANASTPHSVLSLGTGDVRSALFTLWRHASHLELHRPTEDASPSSSKDFLFLLNDQNPCVQVLRASLYSLGLLFANTF